jgi:tRNA(fMet)-specific endonuclease VapC
VTVTYLLDTNMVTYIVRDRSPAASARLLALKDDQVAAVSVITEAEIRYGLARKPEATALKSLMDGFLGSIQVLPWGRNEADAYGRIKARLERSGISLGNMDMMIAAHAIAAGAILVTNDKAFAQVEELSTAVNWATDL